MLTVKRSEFQREIPKDPHGTVDGEPARGILVYVTLRIPHDRFYSFILQRIQSPGLWGVQDDPASVVGSEYFEKVFKEEETTLQHMLEAIGVQVVD